MVGYISLLNYFPHVLDSTREELGHCNGSNLITLKLSKGFLLGGEIKNFIVLRLVRVVSHSSSNQEEGLIREIKLYDAISLHVMVHAICRYPLAVDGVEEEARMGSISESELEVTNSFLRLLGYKNLYQKCQSYGQYFTTHCGHFDQICFLWLALFG